MDSTHSGLDSPTQSPPAWIRPYLWLPYKDYDCWQLCRLVLEKERGLMLPDFHEDYERSADESLWDERIRDQVGAVVMRERERWVRVEGTPQPFDLALYQIRAVRWHLAIVVGGGWALNTNLQKGSHPILLRDKSWAERLEGYYRA